MIHRDLRHRREREIGGYREAWGNGMEWNFLGEYLPASVPRR